jgi:hypothetical protein
VGFVCQLFDTGCSRADVLGEFLLRYHWHPEFKRTTVAEAIRSYMHSGEEQGRTPHNEPQA